MEPIETDLLVIGGGINGVGVAADAAGRGLSVVLCEKDDLANHTSSASTKLVHGGLRYLEQVEFKLVHEALREREILLHRAPHLVHPIEFVLPYDTHLRPAWLIRIGLFLYDCLAGRKSLRGAKKLNLQNSEFGDPLKKAFNLGFSYIDCQTDDARLVMANALLAREKGARIFTRTACLSATRQKHHWVVELCNQRSRKTYMIYAKAIVNATGSWVADTLKYVARIENKTEIRLIKGSHFTLPKLYEGNHAYILQHTDKRIIFILPYKEKFSLIGTTDVPFLEDPNFVKISENEIDYLCNIVNYYFKHAIDKSKINWCYSGVRTLYDHHQKKPQKITREYHLDLNNDNNEAPIISIFGGKITTYRSLAEEVMKKLKPYFPTIGKNWTANTPLPGGRLNDKSFSLFLDKAKKTYPCLPSELITRYSYNYGNLLYDILSSAKATADLGFHFGAGLYEKEVRYLLDWEWAETIEDIIWRRTKLGLFLSPSEVDQLTRFISK